MFARRSSAVEQNVSNYCGVKSIQYWRKVFDEHSNEEEEEEKNGLNLVSLGAQSYSAHAYTHSHTLARNVPILLCLLFFFSYKFWAA